MIEEALEHLKNGNYAAAEALYRRMLEDEPDNPEVLFMLSVTRQGQNDLDGSAELLGRAIRVQPGNPTLHYSLGMVALRRHRLAEAETAFHEATRIDPNFVAAQNGIASVELARGRFAEAEHALRRALRIEPANAQALTQLGLALLKQERAADAIAVLQQVIGADPANSAAQALLGRAFLEAGNTGFAIQCFDNALQQQPDNAELLALRARASLDSGQHADAARGFRRVLDLGGENAASVTGLAQALRGLRRLDEAEGAYLRALRLSGGDEKVLLEFARVLLELGRPAEVVDRLAPRLQGAEDGERMARLLAEARLATGDADGARELLRPLVSGGASDPRLRFLLARALFAAGERAAADAQIDRLLEDEPALVDAVLLRAGQQLDAGDVAAAVERLRGVQRRHDLSHAQRQRVVALLGAALHRNGQYQSAWELYLGLDPRTAEVVAIRDEKSLQLEPDGPAESAMEREVAWSWPPQPLADGRPEPVFVLGWPGSGRRDLLRALAGHAGICIVDDPLAAQAERRSVVSHPQGRELLDGLEPAKIQLARRKYWKLLRRRHARAGEALTVDAMWLTVEALPTVYRLFPQAHLILLRQDPRDLALSWLQAGFRDQEGMARLYRAEQALLAKCQAGVPLKFVEVDTAELLRTPGVVLRDVVASLALAWDAGVERAWNARAPEDLPEPGRWKSYEIWLQPVLEALEA